MVSKMQSWDRYVANQSILISGHLHMETHVRTRVHSGLGCAEKLANICIIRA